MNLNQLKIFYLAARYGHLGKVASDLNITVPGVTLGIHRLEEHYEVKLFKKLGQEVVLTRAGQSLYKAANKIYEMEIWAEDCLRDYQQRRDAHIQIHSIESFGAYYLPTFIDLARKTFPHIRITLGSMLADQVVENTLNMINDLGIISYRVRNNKLVTKELARDEMAFIMRPDHLLAKKKAIVAEDLKNQQLIVYQQGSDIRTYLCEFLYAGDVGQEQELAVWNNEAMKSTVMLQSGIALMPLQIVKKEIVRGELTSVPIAASDCTRKYYLVRHKNRYVSSTLRKILSLITEWGASGTFD